MRPWSETPPELRRIDIARINAEKLEIAIRALSDISTRTQCPEHCDKAAAQALREMGKVNVRDMTSEGK